MKRVVACLLIVIAIASRGHALEAGAAKVDITPPLGTPLNGYIDRWGRGATAMHDEVWARCLYLNDGNTAVFFVSADLCIINRELRDRVLELAPDVVPQENIILTATHNHSAQGAMLKRLLFRTVSGRVMPEVLERTAEGFAEAMRVAYESRRRAAIGYTTTTQDDLSENRRFPDGPIDPQIGVIRVDDADGVPISILANFAAHPTTVGGDDKLTISADYPGYYYSELERLSAPGCLALFTNGAEGNQRCADPKNEGSWERTATIGRLLAERVSEAAETISCSEAALHFARSTPDLPMTIGESILPNQTTLQALEIGDLLLTFFPGEPCAEIGLELRRRAIERGYGAHFTVGLANDHLLYFVPRSLYDKLIYETGMNFYGPHIEDWFYREFSKLMTRGAPEPDRPVPPTPEVSEFAGGCFARISGSPYAVGYQRGVAFREAVREVYTHTVVEPCESGALVPDNGLWKLAPPFIDLTDLAVMRLAIGARPMLAGLSTSVFEEMEGLATATALPFDAAWLIQCLPTYADRAQIEELYRAPFCTMFAVVGDRAGADDVRVGRNFDWSTSEPVSVLEVLPDSGHQFIEIGFPWSVGSFTGMNDAGVVVCAERVKALGDPSLEGPPVALVLREVLQDADDLAGALARIEAASHVRGCHILVAALSPGDMTTRGTRGGDQSLPRRPTARIVECGVKRTIREPSEGLLLGIDPESPESDEEAGARYRRAAALLREKRIVASSRIEEILHDREAGQDDAACVYNPRTLYSAVIVPKQKSLRVAVRRSDGSPGEYREYTLSSGASTTGRDGHE